MKIALAMIVKGSKEELNFLRKSLRNNAIYFDAVYITLTHKKGEKIPDEFYKLFVQYKVNVSHFTWVDDFSKARNFNFSQVPKEYDFIAWCDADDVFFDLSNRKMYSYIEEHPEFDAWTMQYYYDRDESFNPTVVHTKTQVIRNDGCVTWIGRIHEDLKENRELRVGYMNEIKRIHISTNERGLESAKRNARISLKDIKDRPNDPQAYFNLGNALIGSGEYKKAKPAFLKFLSMSNSNQEKYIIYQRLAHVEARLGNKDSAIEYLQRSIGMYPEFPDSYNQLGYLMFDFGMLDEAERYILIGLVTKPQYQKMIVYNPRDYDYNPMMALARVYFKKSRPDLALPMLRGCLKIYPDDEKLKNLVEEMSIETKRLERVIEASKRIDEMGDDKDKILFELRKLPEDLQSHPVISRIRNRYEVKTESSGKDIAYYCGETNFEWNPRLFKTKGFGGSEEAVINLTKEWAKLGYNVTVYNSCGTENITADGVMYKPWWTFNAKDKWDTLILWRNLKLLDYDLNASTILVDLHDVVSEGELTSLRLAKVKKVMVKTKAHRVLFPHIPDNKFAIVPNGQDLSLFNQEIERNPYLLINTSSPDRSMDSLPELFARVKEQVPFARLKWIYGWDNFEKWYASDKRMMAWKEKIQKEMEDAGIEDCGRVPQSEAAKLYLEGRILAYPSDFYEIDCISVKKAQAAGCIPVTTDFAAMEESNQYGIKVHTDRTIKDWSVPYQIGFGTKYEKAKQEWVDAVVKILKTPYEEQNEMKEWAKKFNWNLIASQWTNLM